MNINHVGNAVTIARGLPVIIAGFELLSKPNKTVEEMEIANSFKKFITTTLVLTLVFLISSIIATINVDIGMPDGDKRYGHVEGNQVRYVQNTMQYVPLSEIGINTSDVLEGDSILLFFDTRDDTLIEAMPESLYNEKHDGKLFVLFATLIGSVIMLVGASVIMERTIAKKFRDWHNQQMNEEMNQRLGIGNR